MPRKMYLKVISIKICPLIENSIKYCILKLVFFLNNPNSCLKRRYSKIFLLFTGKKKFCQIIFNCLKHFSKIFKYFKVRVKDTTKGLVFLNLWIFFNLIIIKQM